MLKEYVAYDEDGFVVEKFYLGLAAEVEAEYHKLVEEFMYKPVFTEAPKFNTYKAYALCVDKDDWGVSVITADNFAKLFCQGYIEKAEY